MSASDIDCLVRILTVRYSYLQTAASDIDSILIIFTIVIIVVVVVVVVGVINILLLRCLIVLC